MGNREQPELHGSGGAIATADDVIVVPQKHGQQYFLLNLVHLAAAFFLVFTAFSGIQNIEGSFVIKDAGFTAIAVLYFVFTVSCLATPAVVKKLGTRWSVVSAFLCFITFCVANVLVVAHDKDVALAWIALLAGGAICGFGASFLWTAQGTYMTACAFNYAKCCGDAPKSALGLFSGIFFGIFQLTQISGNLIESLVFKKGDSPVPLFVVYLSCACVGTLLACFLRHVDDVEPEDEKKPLLQDPEQGASNGSNSASVPRSDSSSINLQAGAVGEKSSTSIVAPKGDTVMQLLMRTIALWRNPKMLLLIPLLFLSGLEQGWVFGDFTTSFVQPSLGKANIGYIMACFGAADAIGSFALGKLSDIAGRPVVLLLGFICQAGVAITLLIADIKHGEWAPLIASAAVWGLGDAAWNTQISAILGELFPEDVPAAFANFKLWQSLLMGTAFLLGSALSSAPKLYLWLLLGFLVVSTACVQSALAIDRREKAKQAA